MNVILYFINLLMTNILQWNCRGVLGKLSELSNFILDQDIICLQETWLKTKDATAFGGFHVFRKDRLLGAGGGVAVICRSTLDPSYFDPLGVDLADFEVSAVIINKIRLGGKKLAIFSVYRPPSVNIGWKRWNGFITALSEIAKKYAIIVCGDLNAQHFTWGSSRPNLAGVRLSDAVSRSSWIILNDGSTTRISASQVHVSAPDISLITPDMAGLISWETLEDSRGSDHLPIRMLLETECSRVNADRLSRPGLILKKFNKDTFQVVIDEVFEKTIEVFDNGADAYLYWYNEVILGCLKAGALKIDDGGHVESIDLDSGKYIRRPYRVSVCKKKARNKPWWDSQCQEAVDSRKEAYGRFKKNPCKDTLQEYRIASHVAYKVIKKRRKVNFTKFI